MSEGAYSFTWDAESYPSGIYFVRLLAGNTLKTQMKHTIQMNT